MSDIKGCLGSRLWRIGHLHSFQYIAQHEPLEPDHLLPRRKL